MEEIKNSIVCGDCIEGMNGLSEGSADLVFADPPFNIGYDYDVYNDSREYREYLDWSSRWIAAVHRVLKSDGTFWLAIGDEFAAELKLASQKLGFHCRSWVIWYYTFGVHCSKKFTRSHAHLFHFVKDPKNFTFRDHAVRVPSARELVYNDKRANPAGRMPDDTWMIRPADCVGEVVGDEVENWNLESSKAPSDDDRTYLLRPQDLSGAFQLLQEQTIEDSWYFPRVAGTFKERAGFHGCQMPEQLLGRIVRACSNPGEMVLDPFSGSATTLAVAKKLGRRFVGFDVSEQYVEFGHTRLDAIRVGDPLDGSPEPLKSAPKTNQSKTKTKRQPAKKRSRKSSASSNSWQNQLSRELTQLGVIDAFTRTHDGYSADRVVTDPELDRRFVAACENHGLVGNARTWNTMLFRLRKAGNLSHIETTNRTSISWEHCDKFIFASEIALQQIIDQGVANSLDEILCDPDLAEQFDHQAEKLAPGYDSLEYRWAALKLRKEAKLAIHRSELLDPPRRFGDRIPLREFDPGRTPADSGLYLIGNRSEKWYVGEASNLRSRFELQFDQHQIEAWNGFSKNLSIQILPMANSSAGRLAWQSCLVKKYKQKPRLNYSKLRSAS